MTQSYFNGIEKLSQNLREQVLKIMGQDAGEVDAYGDKGNRISSKNEYDQLCNLLSGTQGTERNVLEGLKIEYEEQAMVRDSVKKSVLDAIKDGDFYNKADFKTEIDALKEYLNRNKKQLNNAEIAFIKRVIEGEEVKMENMFPPPPVPPQSDKPVEQQPTTKPVETQPEKPVEQKPDKPVETQPKKPIQNKPNPFEPHLKEKRETQPEKPVEKKPNPFDRHKPVEKQPGDPVKKPKYIVSEGDSQAANAYARTVLAEITKLGPADNKLIKATLSKINRKTAYSFLKSFNESPRLGNFNKEVFGVLDLFNKLTYKNVRHVMYALVQQANDCGLAKDAAPLQKKLQYWDQCMKEGLLEDNDLNDNQIREADALVNELIKKMDKVIQ